MVLFFFVQGSSDELFIYWIRMSLLCVRWWHLAFWGGNFSAIYSKWNSICCVLHLCNNQLLLIKRLNHIQSRLEFSSDVSVKEKRNWTRTVLGQGWTGFSRSTLHVHPDINFSFTTGADFQSIIYTMCLIVACLCPLYIWNRRKAKWPQCSINTSVSSQIPDCKFPVSVFFCGVEYADCNNYILSLLSSMLVCLVVCVCACLHL